MSTYKFRVRPYFKTTLQYLEWKELLDDVSQENTKQFVLDKILLTIKKQLSQFEIFIHHESFKGARHDQRFSLTKESNEFLRGFAEKNNLLIAEALEILLFIHCQQVLTDDEMRINGLENWAIKVEIQTTST